MSNYSHPLSTAGFVQWLKVELMAFREAPNKRAIATCECYRCYNYEENDY